MPLKLEGYGSAIPTGEPAWSRQADIGDYGGAPDKVASKTEGKAPYAWQVYRMLQSAMGSAYSKETSGTLIHAENLATARLFGVVFWRVPEKVLANSTPAGADEKLSEWVDVLRVRTRDGQQDYEIRDAAAAKFKDALGPTEVNVDAQIRELLGDRYVESIRITGSALSSPPDNTYWPGENPGPSALDLGGGAWFSHRAHLAVIVTKPQSGDEAAFLELMNVQLTDLLDGILPAWMTFGWATYEGASSDEGFLLDISRLDFTGLTAS